MTIDETYDIINAPSTLTTKLSNLDIHIGGYDWSYFYVDTTNSDKLNNYQRVVVERLYGSNFKEILHFMRDSGIKKTSIHVLNSS